MDMALYGIDGLATPEVRAMVAKFMTGGMWGHLQPIDLLHEQVGSMTVGLYVRHTR